MAAKTYTISGRKWTWGALTFGQFEQIAPMLPRFSVALSEAAAGGNQLAVGLAASAAAVDMFQVLAGPDIVVRDLPLDLDNLTTALAEVLTASGMNFAPKGAAPPGEKLAAAKPSRRKPAKS